MSLSGTVLVALLAGGSPVAALKVERSDWKLMVGKKLQFEGLLRFERLPAYFESQLKNRRQWQASNTSRHVFAEAGDANAKKSSNAGSSPTYRPINYSFIDTLIHSKSVCTH